MNEQRLRALLREEPIPGAADAEGRGLVLLERAYAERRSSGRPVLPRLAIALAAATLLAALLLSPAGAAVRNWIGDVFATGVRNAQPALTEVPGGGRLLVQSSRGPWVVQANGSRRLLGDYREATWSPHGLFVASASGRTLSAVAPDGTPHWSISAKAPLSDPRWSPSGFRIAYRAGRSLRVVDGDGSDDRLLAQRTAPVAPAWFPPGLHLVAFIARGSLRIVDADSGETLDVAGAPTGVTELSWSANGRELIEATPHAIWLQRLRTSKLAGEIAVGKARPLPLPRGAVVGSATFAPGGDEIAALLMRRGGENVPRSEALLIDPAAHTVRRLFAGIRSDRRTGLVAERSSPAADMAGRRPMVVRPRRAQRAPPRNRRHLGGFCSRRARTGFLSRGRGLVLLAHRAWRLTKRGKDAGSAVCFCTQATEDAAPRRVRRPARAAAARG